ncbi:MAG TPA: pyridoxamine 5'-phosphate oxidase family protein [Streptosporangiaceae bacterium]|nr:pyridoxamine 5'-phosphate oxidase family protein [Streptosporangiaceae bacterium]
MAEADENRRRLSRSECADLLSRPLTGVFSSLAKAGWIHSVPVHFLYTGQDIRILAGADAVKTRNVARTGQATLCVEVTEGTVRSFVTVSGPVTIQQPPLGADLAALDERYSRTDFSSGWDEAMLAAEVMLTLRPERWIAWADWD